MNELSVEDMKLVTLARSARARISASQGAAVRDETGRTFASANVESKGLTLNATQLTVGQAIASGAQHLEAAVICCDEAISAEDLFVLQSVMRADAAIYQIPLTGDLVKIISNESHA